MSGARQLPFARVGVVGGGQLGRMMAWAARRIGVELTVLDPAAEPPAAGMAHHHVRARLDDPEALRRLAGEHDVVTFEIEHTDPETLARCEADGATIHPSPRVLGVIADKLAQKEAMLRAGVPTARHAAWEPAARPATADAAANGGPASATERNVATGPAGRNPEERGSRAGGAAAAGARSSPSSADVAGEAASGHGPLPEEFSYPVVQKLRFGGYDGRGVKVLASPETEPLQGPSLVETMVDVWCELAVLVVRGRDGEIACYPPFEMAFDPELNICDAVVAPARVAEGTTERARTFATNVVEELGGVGIFAVELLVDRSGRVLVNETAPRPHNSGHLTIEAAATCQFEQHLRAVCGLPLGSTELLTPAAMVNVLGTGATGAAQVGGFSEALAVPGARLHLYGKAQSRPGRKMGHVTACASEPATALARAREAQQALRITGAG